jgi:hypothetical protein
MLTFRPLTDAVALAVPGQVPATKKNQMLFVDLDARF